ncbi:hypothetical protein STRDD11_02535 [Streptococcus sp. DD11]|nr:hypothetical protein STRDD11_02535 [Streptococcus sp. DD11]
MRKSFLTESSKNTALSCQIKLPFGSLFWPDLLMISLSIKSS